MRHCAPRFKSCGGKATRHPVHNIIEYCKCNGFHQWSVGSVTIVSTNFSDSDFYLQVNLRECHFKDRYHGIQRRPGQSGEGWPECEHGLRCFPSSGRCSGSPLTHLSPPGTRSYSFPWCRIGCRFPRSLRSWSGRSPGSLGCSTTWCSCACIRPSAGVRCSELAWRRKGGEHRTWLAKNWTWNRNWVRYHY